MRWQALIIGICIMCMVRGIIFTTRTTRGTGITDGVMDGHGDLGIAGMEASGDGILHTPGLIGDGDHPGAARFMVSCMSATLYRAS